MADIRISSRNAGVGEHRLHQVLAVVEGALDRDVVHVGRVDARHHAALHLAHPAGRVQHDDVERVPPDARLDGRRAGVAGGGHDDRRPLAALAEHLVEQAADELEGDVLEGERRAVPQLLHPQPVGQLHHRAHVGVVEGRVGVLDQRVDVAIPTNGADDGLAPRRRREPRRIGGERGRAVGHVEPAVGGEAGERARRRSRPEGAWPRVLT